MSTPRFKESDKVVCVEVKPLPNWTPEDALRPTLELGKTYVVMFPAISEGKNDYGVTETVNYVGLVGFFDLKVGGDLFEESQFRLLSEVQEENRHKRS